MKWTVAIALVLVLAIGVFAAEVEVSKETQLAHYERQLEELQSLQAKQFAEEAEFQRANDISLAEIEAKASAELATSTATPNAQKKLAIAMKAVKEDILAKLREAQRESKWVKDVEAIVKQYRKKVKSVKKNLAKIRREIKDLIKKKRQIRNAQVQEQLRERLTDASGDLKMVQNKLEAIKAQHDAFAANKKRVAAVIANIKKEMAKLKGEKPKRASVTKAAAKKKAKKAEKAKGGKYVTLKNGKKVPRKLLKSCKKNCKKDDKKCVQKCVKKGMGKDEQKKDEQKKDEQKKDEQKKSFLETKTQADAEDSLLAEFAQ